MTKNNLIKQAEQFARQKHEGQYRDGGADFITHPELVARILTQIGAPEHLIAAAWLHDTIEDTDTTYGELCVKFGLDVADLVLEVTNSGTENIFPYLKTREGVILKFADRLSNLRDMQVWDIPRQTKYIRKSQFWNYA